MIWKGLTCSACSFKRTPFRLFKCNNNPSLARFYMNNDDKSISLFNLQKNYRIHQHQQNIFNFTVFQQNRTYSLNQQSKENATSNLGTDASEASSSSSLATTASSSSSMDEIKNSRNPPYYEKVMSVVKEYGPFAVVYYTFIWLMTLAGSYLVVSLFELQESEWLQKKIPDWIPKEAIVWACSLALNETLEPIRLPFVLLTLKSMKKFIVRK